MNTFSAVQKIKFAANWKNFFRSSLQAVQFASVSSCASRLLKHFSCRSFRIMQTTDDLGMPVFRDISRTLLWVWAGPIDAEPYRSPGQRFHLCWHFAMSLPWRLSTEPVSLNFFSNLLMLLGVHSLFGNSVLNCLALYPFNWYNFFVKMLFVAENHVYKPCINVVTSVITQQTSDCQNK